ncbi:MAG: DUF3794 domain-containing protein [Faecalibacterium sp.]|nr:DUF3794 domain-containing protein [Faecalibacterium sp.]
MEFKVFRDTLSAAGSFCTVQSEIPIETELLISDYLPQVFKIVKCFVKLVVLQKQLQASRLNVEGYLRCIVYYQGENGQGLCQTEQKLPFNRAIELPALDYSTFSTVIGGETEYLNCRAVNQRRVEVRGAYQLSAGVYTQLQQEVITAVADCGAQQKQAVLAGVRCLTAQDKLINCDNEFRFDTAPAAVLDIAGTAAVRELKCLSGKVVAKGEILAELAYRTQSGSLQAQRVTVPFNQILDVEGIAEDCRCLCMVEPVGFTLTEVAAGEGQTTPRLTVSALLHLRAYRGFEINLVADLFSTQYQTELQRQMVTAEQLEQQLDETLTLQASGQLPDGNARLLACFAAFGPVEIAAVQQKAVLRARGVVTAFCENTLQEIESVEKQVEFLLPLGDAARVGQLHAECWLSVQEVNCQLTAGTLEATLVVRAEGVVLGRSAISSVAQATLGEAHIPADPDVALRIYYAQPGEEVFEIARRFHVAPQEMLTVNGLEEQLLAAPRRLLVPGAG